MSKKIIDLIGIYNCKGPWGWLFVGGYNFKENRFFIYHRNATNLPLAFDLKRMDDDIVYKKI